VGLRGYLRWRCEFSFPMNQYRDERRELILILCIKVVIHCLSGLLCHVLVSRAAVENWTGWI
jgi:hypothetical protein